MLNENPMKAKASVWGLLVCLLFCGAQWANAQLTSATLSGTVRDSSGAVVPNAQVTVTNEGTRATRVVSSNASGYYSVPDLDVGNYTVAATAKGFKTSTSTGIDLHVGDQKVLDVTIQVGEATTTIEVKSTASQVQLRSGTVASVVSSIQTSELPLNGRNFLQLALLVPGASPGDAVSTTNTGLLSGSDISMSGASANTNAWLVDGANNVDEGSGRTLLIYPSVDAIQEFKVQRNSMGAENPSAGGAIISVVTKSGTNAFHGSAYDFVRNTILDSNLFFLNAANQPKPKRRYNDYGFTVGGPIKKDKVFFFYSEEWRKDIRGIARRATVPTATERLGNFNPAARTGCNGGAATCLTANAAIPTDPYTGLAFPNNTIPACAAGQTTDCISPAGLAMLQLYPQPNNLSTSFNWVQGVTTRIGTREDSGRIDYNINDRTTLSGRFTNDEWNNGAPNGGSENGLWGDTGFPTVDSNWAQPSKSLSAHLTRTFGANKVNDFAFTYSNNRIYITQGIGKGINDAINAAIPNVLPHTGEYSHAIFWGGPPTGTNLWNEAPWQNGEDLYTGKDDFTWTKGNHAFKIGGLYNHNTKTEPIFGASQVAPEFWGPNAVPGGAGKGGGWGPKTAPGNGGQVTGNNTADLLLQGAYFGESGEASAEPVAYIAWHDIETYYADTWRIRPRLTLEYGLRYVYLPNPYMADNHLANFILSLYNPALGQTATNGVIYPTQYVNTAAGITGGAANLKGINVGNSLRYQHWANFGPRIGFAWDPTGSALWAIRAGAGIFYGRSDLSHPNDDMAGNPPFTAIANCGNGRPLDYIGPASNCSAGVGTPTFGADLNWRPQGSYQWNFTVERQLSQDMKLEVAYVGNRGIHLPIQFNLNQVPLANFVQYQTIAYTPNNNNAQILLRPLNVLKGSGRLPFESPGGYSNYHGLQVYLSKRFSHAYTFGVSYAYSNTLADTSQTCCAGSLLAVNELPHYSYGHSNFDRTHILSMNWIYDVPTFKSHSTLFQGVLGGWETTGVFTADSGLPLFVGGGVGNCPANSCRPDFVAKVQPHTANQWFAPTDYATPTVLGDIGNASPANLRGPGILNFDLGIYKNFPLHWENTSLQFRAEASNAMNHPQFLGVDTGYSSANLSLMGNTIGCKLSTNPYCNTNPTFGKVTNARQSREFQLALKFIF